MLELLAEGPSREQRARIQLATGENYTIGRGNGASLSTTWDPQISRVHADLVASESAVELKKRSDATNAIFYDGNNVESCRVPAGSQFAIGSTLFHVADRTERKSDPPVVPIEEVTFSQQKLKQIRFRDAERQIGVLTHLPVVISRSRTAIDLHNRLVNMLLDGVGDAEAVAIVALDRDNQVEVLHWDRRHQNLGEIRPSERLVRDALKPKGTSVLHVWEAERRSDVDYTAVAEFDWAFCTPVVDLPSQPWGFYVTGRQDQPLRRDGESAIEAGNLEGDVKFTELVAEIISSVKRINNLEKRQAGLRQFFAPPILAALGDDFDMEILEPRECSVTVLFCDLRGFSHEAEVAVGADDLIGLLDRVSRALGVMTHHILKFGGVTGDFQGDAALGFWGWPIESEDSVLNACRAALGIRAEFAESFGWPGHPLANFQMGIGIAHGRAVAGKIGTLEQVKVTVFGPVVNLASRLESMTNQLRVPILLDEATAKMIQNKLDPNEGRTRRLAKVLPFGMENPVLVSELLPSEADWPELTNAHLAEYEKGVDHFIAGEWDQAYRCLHDMPATDRAQDFPIMLIAQHQRSAPPDWDGVVRLPNK